MGNIFYVFHKKSLLWLFLPILILACSDNHSETINEQYLKSSRYTAFKKSAHQEKKRRAKREKSVQDGLRLLPQCKQPNELSLPFQINEENLSRLLKNSGCNALEVNQLKNSPLKLIGKSHFRDADIYFVLNDNDILSTNRQLVAVTFRENHLFDKKVIGLYKKSITKRVSTDVSVSIDGEILKVVSKMNRNIEYPIKQENTVSAQYEIDGRGHIREI